MDSMSIEHFEEEQQITYDISFSHKSDLVQHQIAHSGEKPYQCSNCDKSFSQKWRLVRHQRTHSEKKRYKYSNCDKSFSQKTHLVHHQRTHSGEKLFSVVIVTKVMQINII